MVESNQLGLAYANSIAEATLLPALVCYDAIQQITACIATCDNDYSKLTPALEGLALLTGSDRAVLWLFDKEQSEILAVSERCASSNKSLLGTNISLPISEKQPLKLSKSLFPCSPQTLKFVPDSLSKLGKALIEAGSKNSLLLLDKPDERFCSLITLDRYSDAGGFAGDCQELAQKLVHDIWLGLQTSKKKFQAGQAAETAILNQHLSAERLSRQITSKLHASLDKDAILQTAVDTLGHLLKASACLCISLDHTSSPLVTHEYVNPLLSPLGLGSTALISRSVAEHFAHKTNTIIDEGDTNAVTLQGLEQLFESGIRSLLGCPILANNHNYGILLLQSDQQKHWEELEILILESTAKELARSLHNANIHLQIKEQVFNLQYLSNVSQQLSKALEHVPQATVSEERGNDNQEPPPNIPLSTRELQVLRLIAAGLANKEIAQKLFLTESTIELHAARIRKKLKLKTRTALVKFACDNQLA